MSSANRVGLAYIEEDSFGTPPTNGTLQDIRFVDESFAQNSPTKVSDEIRDDRQASDLRRMSADSGGVVNVEFSYGTFDDWFASALQASAWSSVIDDIAGATTIAFTGSTITDSASGLANYKANQWIQVSGSTSNDGIYKVTAVAAGTITISGTLTTETASASVSLTQGAQIVNGVATNSYAFERVYSDLTNVFAVYKGQMLSQMSLSVTNSDFITGAFTFMGISEESGTATIGDGSNAPANSNTIFSAVDNVLKLLEGGSEMSVIKLDLALQNNLRNRMEVAEVGPVSIGSGSIGLTGTLQIYFTSSTLVDKYLNQTESSIAVLFKDSAGNIYVFDVPRLKFTKGRRVAGGKDTDVIADMEWTAYRNSDEDVTFRIVRFPAS